MSKTWIVVADASRARIFSADKPSGPLLEIEAMSNPDARLHEGDLVSDNRSGRDGNGNGMTHGVSAANTAKNAAVNRFAGEVCARLESGRVRHAFARLYLMGAPAFLGLMRKHVSPSLRSLITHEIAKDLSTQSPDQIRAQLPAYL